MGMVHIDRQIAIWAGWIAGPAFGVAMMASPEYLKLNPPYSGFLFWGGLIVFFATIVVVVALSLHDDMAKKKVIGPILTMALGTLILGGGIAWYFWSANGDSQQTDEVTASVVDHNQKHIEETPLPPNAKFRYKGQMFFAITRPYTKDENSDIRTALRDVYNYISTNSGPIIANYDGPSPMFTREWLHIIDRQGAKSAIKQLDDIRNKVRFAYTELQTVVKRRPYFQQDIMAIIDDRGEVGNMNGSLNEYIEALNTLPGAPNIELIKLAIRDREAKFENAIKMYTDWIIRFNMKMNIVKGELDTLLTIE